MLSEPNARISTRSEAFAQQLLRKPLRAGTAGAGLIAIFVNRGWPAADYEIRRKNQLRWPAFLNESRHPRRLLSSIGGRLLVHD